MDTPTPDGRAISRREFTVESLMALFAGVTITVTGCGGSDSGPTGPSNPGGGDRTGSISANHGHTAVVTAAQISAGNNVTLNIGGTADHPHTVALTATEVTQIGAGTRVAKTSSSDASAVFGTHLHTVTFN